MFDISADLKNALSAVLEDARRMHSARKAGGGGEGQHPCLKAPKAPEGRLRKCWETRDNRRWKGGGKRAWNSADGVAASSTWVRAGPGV